jgi:hypothetical protein
MSRDEFEGWFHSAYWGPEGPPPSSAAFDQQWAAYQADLEAAWLENLEEEECERAELEAQAVPPDSAEADAWTKGEELWSPDDVWSLGPGPSGPTEASPPASPEELAHALRCQARQHWPFPDPSPN